MNQTLTSQKPVSRWWVWLVVLITSSALLAIAVGLFLRMRKPSVDPLIGYVSDTEVLKREYRQYHGRLLSDPEMEQYFIRAAKAARNGDYAIAAELLEASAKDTGVPVVFNDLGLLYQLMHDRTHAVLAFREALARDTGYRTVRENLERMNGLVPGEADPVSQEIEPNGVVERANTIASDIAVAAEIQASSGDIDTFRFVAPRVPRDLVKIEINNRDAALRLGLRIFDQQQHATDEGRAITEPGANLVRVISLPPNTVWFLQLWGAQATAGQYSLLVHPLKAFDAYEPNDDIFSASKIALGQPVEANLMDSVDTDYYSFEPSRAGEVRVTIKSQSNSLIPALTTFTPDMRNSGFGPDVAAGASLVHKIPVNAHETYFLQVWGGGNSSGKYTLTVDEIQ